MLTKIKNYLIDQSIDHSLRTLIISLFLTIIIFAGFRNFKVDDDLIKTFPQNMPSKVIWDNIQEEFGQTEYIFVAFGKKNHNILNDKVAIAQNKLFTDAILNEVQQVDKVISLSTFNKIDGNND